MMRIGDVGRVWPFLLGVPSSQDGAGSRVTPAFSLSQVFQRLFANFNGRIAQCAFGKLSIRIEFKNLLRFSEVTDGKSFAPDYVSGVTRLELLDRWTVLFHDGGV